MWAWLRRGGGPFASPAWSHDWHSPLGARPRVLWLDLGRIPAHPLSWSGYLMLPWSRLTQPASGLSPVAVAGSGLPIWPQAVPLLSVLTLSL